MNKSITEFEKTLSIIPLTNCNFKKSETVLYINEFGVPFVREILGFAQLEDYFNDRFIYLNKDAFWFPVKASELTKIDDIRNLIVSKELLKLKTFAKRARLHESSLIELYSKLEQFRIKMQFCQKYSNKQINKITDKIYRILADKI